MEKFLTTSELAKLFNLNRQTLHFYDKKDVFKPAFINPENGYRMYSHNQIAQLAFIMYLKTIGFSLDKIKELIGNSNLDFTLEQLQLHSQSLKQQYEQIMKIDAIIQRKMNFVKQIIETKDLASYQILHQPKLGYILIGHEKVLYENEIFYYFPTIVFYNYQQDTNIFDKVFGAYVDFDSFYTEYADDISFTASQQYLCGYHHGPYETIFDTITAMHKNKPNLALSLDFICINIIDQFLENDPEKFITEIRIPILDQNSQK